MGKDRFRRLRRKLAAKGARVKATGALKWSRHRAGRMTGAGTHAELEET
jgi:hypothetical protein